MNILLNVIIKVKIATPFLRKVIKIIKINNHVKDIQTNLLPRMKNNRNNYNNNNSNNKNNNIKRDKIMLNLNPNNIIKIITILIRM